MYQSQLSRYFRLQQQMENHVREMFPGAPPNLHFVRDGYDTIIVNTLEPAAFWSARIPYEYFRKENKKQRKAWRDEHMKRVELNGFAL